MINTPGVASLRFLDAFRRNRWRLSRRNQWWDSSEYALLSLKSCERYKPIVESGKPFRVHCATVLDIIDGTLEN